MLEGSDALGIDLRRKYSLQKLHISVPCSLFKELRRSDTFFLYSEASERKTGKEI